MKFVALEGPSLAGKSTVIGNLKSVLAERELSAVYIACYADVLRNHDMAPIAVDPVTREEQLLSVMAHVGLEVIRRREIPDTTDVVILDRSLWTCLAHTWALAMIKRTDARELVFARDVLDLLQPLLPDHVFYLDLDQTDVARRHAMRLDLPAFLASAEFNDGFRHFFLSEAGPKSQSALEYNMDAEAKAMFIANTISSMLK